MSINPLPPLDLDLDLEQLELSLSDLDLSNVCPVCVENLASGGNCRMILFSLLPQRATV